MTRPPISTEAGEPPTGGQAVAYFDGRDHLGEGLASKIALLNTLFGFDERTGQHTKLPPEPLRQEIFQFVFLGKTLRQRTRKPRAPNRFRQSELARVMRIAKPGDRVDVDPISGKISVAIAKPSGEPEAMDLDQWLAKREKNARPA
jgi:hypothetical protein